MSKQGIATNMVGKKVIPKPLIAEAIWKLNGNLRGELFGIVSSVWVSESGDPKCIVVGPFGDTQVCFLEHLDMWVDNGEANHA